MGAAASAASSSEEDDDPNQKAGENTGQSADDADAHEHDENRRNSARSSDRVEIRYNPRW